MNQRQVVGFNRLTELFFLSFFLARKVGVTQDAYMMHLALFVASLSVYFFILERHVKKHFKFVST